MLCLSEAQLEYQSMVIMGRMDVFFKLIMLQMDVVRQ